MLRKRRKFQAILAVALGAATLVGCSSGSGGGSGGTASGELTIGVMLFDTQLPFYAPMQDGIRAEAKKLGVKVDIQDGQSDPTREAQIVQQFVTQRVDAIIVAPSDAEAIVPVAQIATKADIPVVGLTNDVADEKARTTYVGSDNVAYGRMLGEAAQKVGGKDATVAVIKGALGTSSERDRTEGIEDFLKDTPSMKLVESQAADWNNAKALKVGQDFLNKYKEGQIDVIIGEGPETATAARYATKAGRTDVKFVVGDISRDVASLLESGVIAGAVFYDPYANGVAGLEAAARAAQGKKVKAPFDFQEVKIFTTEEASGIPDKSLF